MRHSSPRHFLGVLLGALAVAACQQQAVREDPAPEPAVTLQQARALAARFEQAQVTPPPRSIADVRRLLGSERLIPSDCPQRQARRRQTAQEGRARLEEIHGQATPNWKASTYGSFRVLDLAERSFDFGDYRLATRFIDSGINLARSVRASRPTTFGKWLRDSGENSSLYLLLMHASLARIHATTGDTERAKAALAEVDRLYDTARGDATFGHLAARNRLLAHAHVDHLTGDLASAEHAYRKVTATTHWSPFAAGDIDLAWVGARLTALLRQQKRLLDAELVARTTVNEAWTTYRYTDLQARVGQPANELAAVLLEQDRLEEATYVGRMAVNFYEADCAEPGTLPLVLARRNLIRILAGRGDWNAVQALVAQVRAELASDAGAFVRLYGLDPEPGLALVAAGRGDEGVRWLRDSLERTEAARGPGSAEAAESRGFLAMALRRTGDIPGALEAFASSAPQIVQGQQANTAAGQVGTRSRARTVLADYATLLGEIAAGAQPTATPLDTVDEQFKLAQLLRLGRVQAAYGAAAARGAARDPELAALVREEQDSSELIAVLLDTLNDVAMAPADQVATAVIEKLQTQLRGLRRAHAVLRTEIDRRFPDYRALMRPRALSIAESRRRLAPDEALLAFQVTDTRTHVWAISREGPTAFKAVDLGRDELAAKVRRLRHAVDPGAITTLGQIPDFDLETAADLHRMLLAPVAAAWSDKPHMLVVTDGPLGQLPFAMLLTERATKRARPVVLFAQYRDLAWLARNHAVTVLPAVAALETMERNAPTATSRPLAGFGDPIFGPPQAGASQPVRRATDQRRIALRSSPRTRSADSANLGMLPPLPETADELRAVAAALGAQFETDVYLGARATEEQVKTMDLSGVRVLAFATHGLLPGDIDGLDQPGLALSSPGVTGASGDGMLTLDEVLGLRLGADWAVLSACNTGAADGRGAEAISGLGRAFFYAGAHALLVSNWPVHSEATRDLIAALFDAQRRTPGIARAEALRLASLHLLDSGTYRDSSGAPLFSYSHPIFWAPFSVVGNGR